MRPGLGLTTLLLAASLPSLALASPVNARISQSGLDFARDRVIEMVPPSMALPELKVDMWECSGEPASFELQDGNVTLEVHDFALTLPDHGTIRAAIDVSVEATGRAHFEKLYACYGRETCDARVAARHARVLIDLKPSVDSAGKPHVVIDKLDVQLEPSDMDIVLSNCPEDDIVNLIVDFVKQYGLKLGLLIGQQIAQNEVGPVVEGLVAGFLTYQGAGPALASIPQLEFKAALTGLDITPTGLTVSGDLDLMSRFPAAACLDRDPGDPAVFPGPAPDLGAGLQTDIGLSVNLGLLQDAIYHVWRDGMMCVTPHTLENFGIDLSALDHVGEMLPGFPEGTHFSFEASVREPPRVEGNIATSAKLTIHVSQMEAQLLASLPDNGGTRRLNLDIDASVSASLVMDPRINALALQVDGVKLDRMGVEDHLGLTELGFDFGRIQQLLEQVILPDVLGQIGQIPVTGPVFGGIEGVPIYVLVKELKTTPAYVAVKANLFKAPDNDREAPTTTIDKPAGVVSPANAKLMLGGTDRQIPTELLRYRVKIDGMDQGEPTFVKLVQVGEAGTSRKYRVEAHAIDLAGNEDRAGVTVEVDVDGVVPHLSLKNQLRGVVDDLSPTLEWTATDDRTSPAELAAHLTITQIPARAGEGAELEVSSSDLSAGTTEATLEGLEAGKQYRVVVTVKDRAGNASSATAIFQVSADAAGGCTVGTTPAAGLVSLLLVALALAATRRRSA
jgi:hypothetical protein